VTFLWVRLMMFFGGLEAEGCLSKNGTRSKPRQCLFLAFFSLVFRLLAPLFCSSAFLGFCSSCADTDF
jgi:hypothetical protein